MRQIAILLSTATTETVQ